MQQPINLAERANGLNYMNCRSFIKACFCLSVFMLMQFNATKAQTFLRANGSKIVDANNNEVVLRGMGLGGWLLMEGYMLQVNGGYGQWQIKRDMYLNGASPAE